MMQHYLEANFSLKSLRKNLTHKLNFTLQDCVNTIAGKTFSDNFKITISYFTGVVE